MKIPLLCPGFTGRRLFLIFLLGLGLFSAPSNADISPRLEIGKSLLPAIIAANKNLDRYLDDENLITVYVTYQNNEKLARSLAGKLSNSARIQHYKVNYQIISSKELLRLDDVKAAAIFLVEPVRENLAQLLNLSFKNRTILFSPFKGDIERGVTTGFRVTDKVLPMINMPSLRKTRVKLKAFFLRVAVKYGK